MTMDQMEVRKEIRRKKLESVADEIEDLAQLCAEEVRRLIDDRGDVIDQLAVVRLLLLYQAQPDMLPNNDDDDDDAESILREMHAVAPRQSGIADLFLEDLADRLALRDKMTAMMIIRIATILDPDGPRDLAEAGRATEGA